MFQNQSKYQEVLTIVKKFEKSNDYESESFYKTLLGEVLDKLKHSELDDIQAYHKNLSISTGVNVGLVTTDFRKMTIIRLFDKLFEHLKVDL